MPRTAQPFFRKSDGWWYVTVRDGLKRKQVRLAEGRKNRKAAFDQYHELMSRRRRRQPVAQSKGRRSNHLPGSCAGLLEAFMAHLKANAAPTTYAWYYGYIGDFARVIGDDILATEVRPHHVTSWIDAQTDWRDPSKIAAIRSVRRAFRWGAEQGLIETYPLLGLKAPKRRTREKVLSYDEYSALLAAAKEPRFRDAVEFLWHTGARPQELFALEARHVDRENRRAVLPASEAKGKRAPRAVYFNEAAYAIVDRLMTAHPAGKLFRSKRGKPWNRNSFRLCFKRLETKLGALYCGYNLRHSFATEALARGVDSMTVGVLMGHADPSTVARVYQHLAQRPDVLIQAANKVR